MLAQCKYGYWPVQPSPSCRAMQPLPVQPLRCPDASMPARTHARTHACMRPGSRDEGAAQPTGARRRREPASRSQAPGLLEHLPGVLPGDQVRGHGNRDHELPHHRVWSAALHRVAELVPPAVLEVARVVRRDAHLGDVSLVLPRNLVDDVSHIQAWVSAAVRPATQRGQHDGVDPVRRRPRERPAEGSSHHVAVPVVGILLLLAEGRPRGQAYPDDVHLWGLAEPEGALLRGAPQDADARGVDQAAHVQRVADGRVDVGLHGLKGLEVRGAQEHLVLAEVAVAGGRVPGIADAREAEHCHLMVRGGAADARAGVQRTPLRHAGDGRAAAAWPQRLRLGHAVRRVEAGYRPREVAAIDLHSARAAVARRPE
mmetsp:Transcript_68751/g.212586  ORF Transcript_68751/g.212586 Transcript_68751/m.212586 type:complete len:371 (+) Transcript_68751:31-1143(+)